MTIHFGDSTSIDSGGSLGKVVQVTSHVKTDTSSFSISSGGYHHDSNFAGSITPSSASNKILVQITVNHGTSSNQISAFKLLANDSTIQALRGDSSGSRLQTTGCYHSEETAGATTIHMTFLHSPSSTSQQTYTLEWRHNSSSTRTHYINRSSDDNNASGNGMGPRSCSSIVLMEIAA